MTTILGTSLCLETKICCVLIFEKNWAVISSHSALPENVFFLFFFFWFFFFFPIVVSLLVLSYTFFFFFLNFISHTQTITIHYIYNSLQVTVIVYKKKKGNK